MMVPNRYVIHPVPHMRPETSLAGFTRAEAEAEVFVETLTPRGAIAQWMTFASFPVQAALLLMLVTTTLGLRPVSDALVQSTRGMQSAMAHEASLWPDLAAKRQLKAETVARSVADGERHMILAMVREHRRLRTEAWRQKLVETIHRESIAAGVDPLLVSSIVAKESSFDSRIVSQAGAVGLMQLRPFVAQELAGRLDIGWDGDDVLLDPEFNVRMGIFYYKQLVDLFGGDHAKALTAYNHGPTRVTGWLRAGTYAPSSYAQDVLALYHDLGTERAQIKERAQHERVPTDQPLLTLVTRLIA